jgi:hypothetical protein
MKGAASRLAPAEAKAGAAATTATKGGGMEDGVGVLLACKL